MDNWRNAMIKRVKGALSIFWKYLSCTLFVFTVIVYADENGKKMSEQVKVFPKGYPSLAKTEGDIVNVDINNIFLPLQNNGLNGNNGDGHYPNGTNLVFLFQGGLAMSGYVNGDLRTGWMAPAALCNELQPGSMNQDPQDSTAIFYEVRKTDGFGSANYVSWQNAVEQGADFQDLDGNGVYDPNIDKPDILGDITYWTVFHDSTSASRRTPRLGTLPLEVEIHQTVWALNRFNAYDDMIFFRYRLINKNIAPVDSFYFSHWSDPDIGDIEDDLIGIDVLRQMGYCYNNGFDASYGSNPPAFGVRLLQGPIVSAVGDTAYSFGGDFFKTDTVFNSKNMPIASFMTWINGNGIIPSPGTAIVARNYQLGGRDAQGNPLDQTAWGIGGTSSDDPKFFYSGDPTTGTGWFDNSEGDKRMLLSTGPFTFAPGDTQNIIVAYIVGQGTNSLASLIKLRERAELAINYIGFDLPPVVGIDVPLSQVSGFQLFANYPNPFNPSTTIQYELPSATQIKLTVFDPLGREVRTLVDSHKNAGENHVVWDGRDASGNDVASGTYIYQLITESTSIARKMLLVR